MGEGESEREPAEKHADWRARCGEGGVGFRRESDGVAVRNRYVDDSHLGDGQLQLGLAAPIILCWGRSLTWGIVAVGTVATRSTLAAAWPATFAAG